MLAYTDDKLGLELSVKVYEMYPSPDPMYGKYVWEWCLYDTRRRVVLDNSLITTAKGSDSQAMRRLLHNLKIWMAALERNAMVKVPPRQAELDLFDIKLSDHDIDPADMLDYIENLETAID